MSINHTEVRYLQNAVEANIMADEIGILHILAISDHRNHTSVKSFNKKIRIHKANDGTWL